MRRGHVVRVAGFAVATQLQSAFAGSRALQQRVTAGLAQRESVAARIERAAGLPRAFLAARISRFRAGFLFGSKQSSLSAEQLTQAFMIAFRCRATILEPVTSAATFCSSFTFQSI